MATRPEVISKPATPGEAVALEAEADAMGRATDGLAPGPTSWLSGGDVHDESSTAATAIVAVLTRGRR